MTAKPEVRIQWVNFFPGFDHERCRADVLMELQDNYAFSFVDREPDILLVGCYGQQPVERSGGLTVGYYTENLAPDLEHFDYFFGCEYTDLVDSPRYCKRVFGPLVLDLFEGCRDPDAALRSKARFCNFIYSTRVPHRERFFRALERYKPVAAPGRAMNNCADLAVRESVDWQAQKLGYLGQFKFTISFENSLRPGYATEKLYDALRADTVPVYWGDPLLGRIVNPDAMIVVGGDWEREVLPWLRLPERRIPYRPYLRDPALPNRVAGRLNDMFGRLRANWPYSRGFAEAIEQIIELDQDDEAYRRKLAQPRLREEVRAIRADYFAFWRGILDEALARREGGRLAPERQAAGRLKARR